MDIKELSKLLDSKKIVTIGDAHTVLDIDPDKILAGAFGKLTKVVLAGVDTEGKYYFASSTPDAGEILWLQEKLKLQLLIDED